MSRAVALLISALLLQGCTNLHVMSHVPLSTMSRLSSLRLAEIEPAELRVAARMPEHIEPRRDGVKVRIDVAASGQTAGFRDDLTLEAAVEPDEFSALSSHRRGGTRLWVYRLSGSDVTRLRRTNALAAGRPEVARVSIAVGVDACSRAPLGSARLETTTFLRTNASGFFVLTEDLDLRSVVPERDLATKVPPCE